MDILNLLKQMKEADEPRKEAENKINKFALTDKQKYLRSLIR